MADVSANVKAMYSSGDCERTVLLAIRSCSSGDTFDVFQWLNGVKKAVMIGDTANAISQLAAATVAAGKTTPTVLTIPTGTGVAQDAVWVLAIGVAAP